MAAETFEDIILSSTSGIWVDSRAYADLNALVADIGANPARVIIAQDEIVSSDLTIPAEYTLVFEGPAGQITNSAILSVLTSKIESSERQIFEDDSGTWSFADGTVFEQGWFASLAECLSLIDGTKCTLLAEQTIITDDTIVPADIFVIFKAPGREWSVSSGKTLTLTEMLRSGPWESLLGTGSFVLPPFQQWDVRWFNTFEEAIGAIAAIKATLAIKEDISVVANTIVPATLSLEMIAGAKFITQAGVTLTVNSLVIGYVTTWYDVSVGAVVLGGTFLDMSGEQVTAANLMATLNNDPGTITAARLNIGAATDFDSGYDPSVALTVGEAAQVDATQALADAATAEALADGKVVTFYQAGAPNGVGEAEGDLWVDTDDSQTYIYNTGAWVSVQDDAVAQAAADASAAQASADGKTTSFFSSTAPTTQEDGDTWYDTSSNDTEGNIYMWHSVSATWKLVSTAFQTYSQSSTPSSPKLGDYWTDTDDNILYRYDGAAWIVQADYTMTTIESGVVTTGKIIVKDGGGTEQAGLSGSQNVGADVRIWAGETEANKASAPFRVLEDGSFFATLATIVGGTSSASSGARFDIDPENGYVRAYNTAGEIIFQIYLAGAGDPGIGDVIIGQIASGTYVKWDDSAGLLTLEGSLIVTGNLVSEAISSVDGAEGTGTTGTICSATIDSDGDLNVTISAFASLEAVLGPGTESITLQLKEGSTIIDTETFSSDDTNLHEIQMHSNEYRNPSAGSYTYTVVATSNGTSIAAKANILVTSLKK